MLNDSQQRYGLVTRFFHWVTAVLVLQQFFKFADHINEGKHWLGDTFGPFHASIGSLILLLTILRLIWVSRQSSRPAQATDLSGKLAKITHRIMYACMLLMPPLGMLYIYGKGYPVKLFGVTVFDKPAGETAWMIMVGNLHAILALLLVLLVLGHISAAIYHHYVRRDDTLKRML